ncbi:phosphopentomutase [Carboxydocella sporoproducens DSM 16521]|uniref:Phosphopentomutase n=2 Tax=Carboxydocella TaxID=178898 RepID=A0A1T4NJP5_9FIRM|nr:MULTISPECIES: phosphopentomutase [Carboxydocella]AVX20075.1 phosphopentomutase [Carboxydocella thermautotrophica]AVX30492.1 phosphopentomutase [Carboxydocella thermautotrophica]SJZ79500.1 phosphopentomutase [Carboxydocella sporoproducens DSM 16521]
MAIFKRAILIVLDSAGIGALPDADRYGDAGADTLGHISERVGGLKVPNLIQLGLANIRPFPHLQPISNPRGAYGRCAEMSNGKDTTTGHWEMAGIILEKAFRTYPQGFPPEIIAEFERRIGRKTLGNVVASGTVIIEQLGEEHMRTGYPIVYTSADSVFQIAAHEEVIPIEELYRMCQIARELLVGDHAVGRVIARPFIGQPGAFKRTERRHDYSLQPPKTMLLDKIKALGLEVMAVGKIKDIYDGRGVTQHKLTKSNMDAVDKTLEFMDQGDQGLIFANLVDFDSLYGHRNDVEGYARALSEFDQRLPEIMGRMGNDDLLIITADHGCDPTDASTDHSREYTPLLVYSPRYQGGVNLGTRSTFADIGQTIARALGTEIEVGTSFLAELK